MDGGERADLRTTLDDIQAQADVAARAIAKLADVARAGFACSCAPTARRLVYLNDLVVEVLRALGERARAGGGVTVALDPRLPSVVGDPRELRSVLHTLLVALIREREISGDANPITVHTSQAPAVLQGEHIARVALAGAAGRTPPAGTPTMERGPNPAPCRPALSGAPGPRRAWRCPVRDVHRLFPAVHTRAARVRGHPHTMKILAVDDSATMRRIIRNQLKQAGYEEVDEAGNGREALTMLALARYDLLITDWNMPEMNGLDLVKEVRRIDASKTMPILMVTTVAGKEDIVTALKAGVNNYMVKPFDTATLRAKIAQVAGVK